MHFLKLHWVFEVLSYLQKLNSCPYATTLFLFKQFTALRQNYIIFFFVISLKFFIIDLVTYVYGWGKIVAFVEDNELQ